MNTLNSNLAPGTLQVPTKPKSNFRLAVFVIVALHLVVFAGLLQQGCRQKAETGAGIAAAATNESGAITTPAYPDTTGAGTGAQQIAGVSPAPSTPAPAAATPAPAASTPAPAATTPAPGPDAAAAGAAKEYVVVKGDTPAKIAKQHNLSVKDLLAANPGLQPRKLQIKQKLVIPAAAAATPAATTPAAAAPAGVAAAEAAKVHVVKRGDNLTKIAKLHGTTVKALRSANSLKTDRIHEGQKLKIPAPAQKGTAEEMATGAPPNLAATNIP
jgi:LysM repeat protein